MSKVLREKIIRSYLDTTLFNITPRGSIRMACEGNLPTQNRANKNDIFFITSFYFFCHI